MLDRHVVEREHQQRVRVIHPGRRVDDQVGRGGVGPRTALDVSAGAAVRC